MKNNQEIKKILESFTGEFVSVNCQEFDDLELKNGNLNIGYSQFNELLLLLGFDRVSRECFSLIANPQRIENHPEKLSSIQQLENGVKEFIKLSVLLFANKKKGFKALSKDGQELKYHLETLKKIDKSIYENRHHPILPILPIDAEETYLMGYIVEALLNEKIKANPEDQETLKLLENRRRVIEQGTKNHIAYLASDHLDIYVATSMRLKHEYIMVNDIINELENKEGIKGLNLRFFNPTQAYCKDRIDKGLSEGLMLKRAKCTLYLAQESDTLGKDSELASTLAQGKPVIALVPTGDEKFVKYLLDLLETSNKSKNEIILEQIQVYKPSLAWEKNSEGEKVRKWIENINQAVHEELYLTLKKLVYEHYEKRAKILKEDHPLGIQVDIDTGVATGVLVVRNIEQCAKLIRSIVLKELEFDLEPDKPENNQYTFLKEKISQSIFRVVTGDPILTNAFWNFYFNNLLFENEEEFTL